MDAKQKDVPVSQIHASAEARGAAEEAIPEGPRAAPFLRDYQESGVAACRAHFADGARSVLAVAPTGAGKTRMLTDIVRRAFEKGTPVLILAHLRVLVQQMGASLEAAGLPVTYAYGGVDPALAPANPSAASVIVGTPHSWLMRRAKPEARLLIIDEAHHAAEEVYAPIWDHYAPRGHILGVTATPCESTLELFEVAHAVASHEDLQSRGILVQGRYHVWDPLFAEDAEGRSRRVPPILENVVSEWMRLSPERKTLVFCHRVEESRKLVMLFQEAGISAAHVDAGTPRGVREEIHRKHADGEIQVVSNVGIYLEGYDNPGIDAVVLLRFGNIRGDAEGGLRLYVQMCGRGFRSHPGKTDCHILDFCGNFGKYGPAEHYIPEMTPVDDDVTNEAGAMRECPCCRARVLATLIHCTECGVEMPLRNKDGLSRAQMEIPPAEAELREISPEEYARSVARKRDLLRRAERASSRAELERLCRELGYKPGWVYYRWRWICARRGEPPTASPYR